MSAGRSKLTRKMETAVAALLSEPTHATAAAAAGVAASTLHRWLQRPEFVAAYRTARRAVVEQAVARLQQVTGEAVETLRQNLSADNPNAQIRAALGILDYAHRGL